jgi:hypothetical protein
MSNCGICLSSSCEFGDNGFWKVTKAFRTSMQCCECGAVIPAGEVHERARYREDEGDGQWVTQHTCAVCAEIAWAFFCDSRAYGQLWERMEDVFEKFSVACLDRLQSPKAKAELQYRWRKWKGLLADVLLEIANGAGE